VANREIAANRALRGRAGGRPTPRQLPKFASAYSITPAPVYFSTDPGTAVLEHDPEKVNTGFPKKIMLQEEVRA
jgi:hypothetical protein